jgi:ComF family protein
VANLPTQNYGRASLNQMLEQAQLNKEVCHAYAPFLNAGENGGLINVLYQLKYAKRAFLARDLVALASPGLDCFFEQHQFDVLAPVPMHFTKIIQRGFNQAALLAREISKRYAIAVDPQLLSQRSRKKSQASKTRSERHELDAHLFKANSVRAQRYRHVLLVDDVFTTGSTLGACFEALKKQAVPEVSYLTLFYTPLEYAVERPLEL